jgi:hypothetical protein
MLFYSTPFGAVLQAFFRAILKKICIMIYNTGFSALYKAVKTGYPE